MQKIIYFFSKNLKVLFSHPKNSWQFLYKVISLISLMTFGVIQHNALAETVIINGVSMNITGSGSTVPIPGGSTSLGYSCYSNLPSTYGVYLGYQPAGTGSITYTSDTPLTQLDIYFTNFNVNERIQIPPITGVIVTTICGVSAKGSGVYGGDTYPSGGFWHHMRFTSTSAEYAFTTVNINATVPGNGWSYFIPVNGPVTSCKTPVSITNQLVAQNVCSGSGYSFNLTSTGNNLVYDWQFKDVGQTAWTSVFMSSSRYDFTNYHTGNLNSITSNVAHNGRSYRVIISNPCGGSVVSNTVQVNIKPAINIAIQPVVKQNVCSGTRYVWSVAAIGSDLTYNWQFSDDGEVNWINASEAGPLYENYNTRAMTVRGADLLAQNGRKYRVAIGNGTCTMYSNVGTVAIFPALPAPILSTSTAENNCPETTVDVTGLVASQTPAGSTTYWENVAVTDYVEPTAVGAGTYKAHYHNFSYSGTCISPDSEELKITITTCRVLPVDLVSFQGKALLGGSNELNWLTASEKNNDHFEIQSSTDARNFGTIGRVEGNGTVFEQNLYKFTDKKPKAELTYYRLKQIDLNETFEYSGIIAVQNAEVAKSFVVYPNPAINELGIMLDKNMVITETTLYDMKGKRVLIQTNSSEKVNVGSLKAGIYTVDVKTSNGEYYRQQFLKY